MRKKIFFLLIIMLTGLILNFDRLIGLVAEPILETKLTSLFGMPVHFGPLKVNPFTGRVKASGVEFINQENFSPGPHLDIEEMEFYIDFLKLREKHVLIHTIRLKRPLYFIESLPDGKKGTVSNIGTWVRHIKKKSAGSNSGPGKRWKVTLPEINIQDGAFIFKQIRRKNKKKKFVFRDLNGFLKGFEWPTADPAQLLQDVQLNGTFGEEKAPMRLKGKANFATSRVSFRIVGEIKDGAVEKHPFIWQGLPFKVMGGKFFLKTKMVCVKRQLKVDSELLLKALQLVPKKSPSTLFWGLPLMATVGFLQQEKTIQLQIPVKGDISDPQFGFTAAFQNAFQDSLNRYAKTGNEFILKVPAKLAAQTEELVVTGPTKVIGGIGKISSTIVKSIPPLPSFSLVPTFPVVTEAETKPEKKDVPKTS